MNTPQPKTKEFSFYDHRDGTTSLRMPPHLHRELELVCLWEGELTLRVDAERCELRAGDLLLILPEQVHAFEDERGARYYRIRVSPDLFPDLAPKLSGRIPTQPILIGALYLSKIEALLGAIEEIVRDPEREHEYSQGVCRGYLLALLSELCSMTSFRRVGGEAQTVRAIVEAESYNGPSIVIGYAPCEMHGVKGGMTNSQNEIKKAVDAGYWHLFRYDPRKVTDDDNGFVLDSKEPTESYQDFIRGETRYQTLLKMFPDAAEKLFAQNEEDAKARLESYKKKVEAQG